MAPSTMNGDTIGGGGSGKTLGSLICSIARVAMLYRSISEEENRFRHSVNRHDRRLQRQVWGRVRVIEGRIQELIQSSSALRGIHQAAMRGQLETPQSLYQFIGGSADMPYSTPAGAGWIKAEHLGNGARLTKQIAKFDQAPIFTDGPPPAVGGATQEIIVFADDSRIKLVKSRVADLKRIFGDEPADAVGGLVEIYLKRGEGGSFDCVRFDAHTPGAPAQRELSSPGNPPY